MEVDAATFNITFLIIFWDNLEVLKNRGVNQ